MPNAKILGDTIINFTTNPTCWVDIPVAVDGREGLARVRTLLLAVVQAEVRGQAEPAADVAGTARILGGVQLEVRVWVDTKNYWGVHGALIAGIQRTLR